MDECNTCNPLISNGKKDENYVVKRSEVEPGFLLRWNEDFKSIIAFVNPESGGRKGELVIENLKKHLPHENVYDLKFGGPKIGLEKHKDNEVGLRIIACGGTVGWVLSTIDKINFFKPPSVAIIPLGTGNDLARVMGWEGSFHESTKLFLSKVISARKVNFDRWSIVAKPNQINSQATSNKYEFQVQNKLPLDVINNYFSLGSDAEVALHFHLARKNNPQAFDSKTFNKIKYGQYSAKCLFKTISDSLGIADNIQNFYCDDNDYLEKIKTLKLKSILVLNIPSYAGGTNPWNYDDKGYSRQNYNDCKLEILGFSIMDFALLKMGGKGHTIAQGSKIKIVTKCPLPMQIDGEPFLMEATEILIDLKCQSTMLTLK